MPFEPSPAFWITQPLIVRLEGESTFTAVEKEVMPKSKMMLDIVTSSPAPLASVPTETKITYIEDVLMVCWLPALELSETCK